ncbi:MAG: hypothetical protein WAW88_04760 [Nocardioides sp.]
MAITIEPWMSPVMDFYGLDWPDVDEDKIFELGSVIADVASETFSFCISVNDVLKGLKSETKSKALDELQHSWQEFTLGTMMPTSQAVGESAMNCCTAASNAVAVYKSSLLAILTVNVGADAAALATGAGAVAVVAAKELKRQVLREALHWAAQQTADLLRGAISDVLECTVIEPIRRRIDDFETSLADSISEVVAMQTPLRGIVTGTAGALYLDHHAVADAGAKLKTSMEHLDEALDRLLHWGLKEHFQTFTPRPDPTVRHAVKEAFDWFMREVVRTLKMIGQAVVSRLISLVTETYEKYVAADEQLALQARALSEKLYVPPPPAVVAIDRSAKPRTLTVWEAPPTPVLTGAATSDARFSITIFDLPDAPDVVLTGLAESDARSRIGKIMIEEAPEPVTTGAARSDASKGLKTFTLPDFGA